MHVKKGVLTDMMVNKKQEFGVPDSLYLIT